MDTRQLRYFLVLSETLHFGRAAELLNITQPPLSRQIAALEETVGTVLFRRTSRNVTLTPAGEDFARHVRQLFDDMDSAARSARATASGEHGSLRLAFTIYSAWYLMPALVAFYSQRYPEVDIRLEETLARNLTHRLQRQEADFGISLAFPVAESPFYLPLLDEPLCAVLPDSHPLAQRKTIQISELAQESFIGFPSDIAPGMHHAVMQCCLDNGFEPKIRLETHLQQTIVNLVAHGLGVALVPSTMSGLQLAGAKFIALDNPPEIELGLSWTSDIINPSAKCFLECCEEWRIIHHKSHAP